MVSANPSSSFKNFQKKLLRSRFFTISVILHLLLILTFGGTVLFNRQAEPPDFVGGEEGSFITPDVAPAAPQPQTMQQPAFTPPSVNTPTAPSLQTITTTAGGPSPFELPAVAVPSLSPVNTIASVATPAVNVAAHGLTAEAAKGLANFAGGWGRGGGQGSGTAKNREFRFSAYLAQYNGGDWHSTIRFKKNSSGILGGSLINLLNAVKRLSHGKIQTVEMNVISLASDEIFAKKPPFIFFTGHKDFILTDAEVENLQKYVRLGGCIWGDSSLPGLRSRFDIAFRREMKRVVADVDKEFEPLPPNHEIYTNAYFPDVREVPPGMNYYKEPVYALKVYDEIAVIYTPNDYGDLWQFGLNDRNEFDLRNDKENGYLYVNWDMWKLRNIYYRNVTPASVLQSYKFGTNIVVHLLTRWDDKIRTVPRGL